MHLAETGLRGAPDEAVREAAANMGRVLVTHNVRDFLHLVQRWSEQGRNHPGILLVGRPMSVSEEAERIAEAIQRHADGLPGLALFV